MVCSVMRWMQVDFGFGVLCFGRDPLLLQRLISALASAGHEFSWRERPRGKEPCQSCHPVQFIRQRERLVRSH